MMYSGSQKVCIPEITYNAQGGTSDLKRSGDTR